MTSSERPSKFDMQMGAEIFLSAPKAFIHKNLFLRRRRRRRRRRLRVDVSDKWRFDTIQVGL